MCPGGDVNPSTHQIAPALKTTFALRPVIDRCCMRVVFRILGHYGTFGEHFQSGQFTNRPAVPLPADESSDGVTFLHPRVLIQPMFGHGARRVPTADSPGESPISSAPLGPEESLKSKPRYS